MISGSTFGRGVAPGGPDWHHWVVVGGSPTPVRVPEAGPYTVKLRLY